MQQKGRLGRWVRDRTHFHTRAFAEALERRLLLSSAVDPVSSKAIELFGISPALFVENQGQWPDASIRYLHQGSGANGV